MCTASVNSVVNEGSSLLHECSSCLAQDMSPKLYRPVLSQQQSKSSARSIKHFPKCSLKEMESGCKCRSLRHSSSNPDVYKGGNLPVLRLKYTNLEQSPTRKNTLHTLQNAHNVQDNVPNGESSIITSNKKCSNNNCNEVVISDHEDEHDEHCEAQDIHAIENLLDLETSYLTDSSVHSSDHSSDEHSDVEFDIPYEP